MWCVSPLPNMSGVEILVGRSWTYFCTRLILRHCIGIVLHEGYDLHGWYGQEWSIPSCNSQPAKNETPNCSGLRNISAECEGLANDVGCGLAGFQELGFGKIWGQTHLRGLHRAARGWTGLRVWGKNYAIHIHVQDSHDEKRKTGFEVRHIWGGCTGLDGAQSLGQKLLLFSAGWSVIHMCNIPMLSFLYGFSICVMEHLWSCCISTSFH